MTAGERGFLLLTSHLGNHNRRVLSISQLRTLAQRVRNMAQPVEDRDLTEKDLVDLGYSREMAGRIVGLLEEEAVLNHYLTRAYRMDCVPIIRSSEAYPVLLRQRLGLDSPGCLWAKGNTQILNTPAVSLVGSRDLLPDNRGFAEAVGIYAAKQGLTLVSGNARGADRAAQEACLNAGGQVISILADDLSSQPARENVLYLSEEDFDEPFSAQRALSRNRCIHALGRITFVAQCGYQKGGTWDGTAKNLHFGWSPVACFRDGSKASAELEQMGAYLLSMEDLKDFSGVPEQELTLF